MSSARTYGGLIWTNHALDRLGQRGLTQDLAWQTFNHPEKTSPGKNGSWQYEKKVQNSTVTIIAKQNEKNEWLILSCWINPPLYGTTDYRMKKRYKQYQKASFWGKFWLTIKSQLGF